MAFRLTQELNERLAQIRESFTKIAKNETRQTVSIKTINAIPDKSNSNLKDSGRNIDELLEIMTLTDNVKNYLKGQYQNVQAHYQNIQYYSKEQISVEATRLNNKGDNLEINLVLALMNKANKIVTGYELRPVQILSVLEFFREKTDNKFCQINTGEGKTTVTSAIAVIKALQGETVDIITSNEVLAQDAIIARSDFYALFNLSVAHNNTDLGYQRGIKDCYANDIVYGTISNFEADHLRHKVGGSKIRGTREFGSLIIDEADNVVLDNAMSSVRTSRPIAGMETLQYIYINIWQELILVEQRLGLQDMEPAQIMQRYSELMRSVINRTDIKNKSIIPKFLESYIDRKLEGWIESAISARYNVHQDQKYIIDRKDIDKKELEQENIDKEAKIIPVDVAVGVTQQNTVWTGLHPFVQIKHNLQITQDSLVSVFIANSEYVKLYNSVSGLTGTLGSSEEQGFIKELYNANSTIIPTYKDGKMQYETNLLVEDNQWLTTIATDAIDHAVNQRRAALVVCNTRQDVLDLQNYLVSSHVSSNKINIITYIDEHDTDKIEEINQAGIKPGTIVIATNIGGRGTDIKLSTEVKENGGLHECTTFLASSRILKQASGRAARQGEPGSSKIIIKQHDAQACGINLNINFSNQDIYDFFDLKNSKKIQRSKDQIKSTKIEAEYFAQFVELYTKAQSLKINDFILEDLKLQWALALDERSYNKNGIGGDVKIKDVFAKFQAAIDDLQNYDHQFVNPYFAINYADTILADKVKVVKQNKQNEEENNEHNEENINLIYDKARRVLNQNSVVSDPELLYVHNMKLFELTISLAQRNELKRFIGDMDRSLSLTQTQDDQVAYKVRADSNAQAKKYLENAQQALMKRAAYLENLISAENFGNIILPKDALNNSGENYMLKHLTSKYATLQLQLQYVSLIRESIKNSGDSLIYISAQHSLMALINKIQIGNKDLTNKICQEELMQSVNAGEGNLSYLKTLPIRDDINSTNPKIQAAMGYIAGKFAESTLISNRVFDIIKVIFSQEKTSQNKAPDHLFNAVAFDFTKVLESLKILHRIGEYASQDISKIASEIASNSQFVNELVPKVIEKIEVFEGQMANITPNASIKAPKKLNPTLRGNENKDQDIGGINAFFSQYTLDAIRNILKLRIQDAGIDKFNNIKVVNNDYLFIDRNSNNIQDLLDELKGFTDSAIVLIPLNISDKHAVGMICLVEHDKFTSQNKFKIYYIDPENRHMPLELENMLISNLLDIKQLTIETQKYANCGPEVIENFMLCLTGERLSQEEAILYHSLLVEQDLKNNGEVIDMEQGIMDMVDGDYTLYNEQELCLIGLLPVSYFEQDHGILC